MFDWVQSASYRDHQRWRARGLAKNLVHGAQRVSASGTLPVCGLTDQIGGVMRRVPALLLGAIGLTLLVVGVVIAISIPSTSGVVVLVAVGALLLLSPFIINRIERLSVSASGLELGLAREMTALGAPKTAKILEHTDLANFAESYAFVHEELTDARHKEARTHLEDLLVHRAAAIARREKFDVKEVRTLFSNATPMMRVLVLGLMEGDPSLADPATMLSAIADPRSENEQYHGLLLAQLCWPRLAKADRFAIRSAVSNIPELPVESDRRPLVQVVMHLPVS